MTAANHVITKTVAFGNNICDNLKIHHTRVFKPLSIDESESESDWFASSTSDDPREDVSAAAK